MENKKMVGPGQLEKIKRKRFLTWFFKRIMFGGCFGYRISSQVGYSQAWIAEWDN